MKNASLVAVCLGVILLALSAIWTTLVPGNSDWTPEKADRWTEIKSRMHNLAPRIHDPAGNVSMHSGEELAQLKQEFDTLQVEHDELQAQFHSAATRSSRIAQVFKWAGVSLAIMGIIGWYASSQMR